MFSLGDFVLVYKFVVNRIALVFKNRVERRGRRGSFSNHFCLLPSFASFNGSSHPPLSTDSGTSHSPWYVSAIQFYPFTHSSADVPPLGLHGYKTGSLSRSGAITAGVLGYFTLANPLRVFGGKIGVVQI